MKKYLWFVFVIIISIGSIYPTSYGIAVLLLIGSVGKVNFQTLQIISFGISCIIPVFLIFKLFHSNVRSFLEIIALGVVGGIFLDTLLQLFVLALGGDGNKYPNLSRFLGAEFFIFGILSIYLLNLFIVKAVNQRSMNTKKLLLMLLGSSYYAFSVAFAWFFVVKYITKIANSMGY